MVNKHINTDELNRLFDNLVGKDYRVFFSNFMGTWKASLEKQSDGASIRVEADGVTITEAFDAAHKKLLAIIPFEGVA